MIKHIVMFKIKGAISFEEKEKAAWELSPIFSPLEPISTVTQYRTGVNFSRGDATWDFTIDYFIQKE